ncbi:MAG: agmatine deiminase family protein [Alphaproteobacteria bacterium]|nr:agmatine deiminase family protein [Alphaproteobacteria bacterium]
MTPLDEGFFLAPEWLPVKRYWLAWPEAPPGLDEQAVESARLSLADLARGLAALGPVSVLANPAQVVDVSLYCGAGVGAVAIAHDHCCMRAVGPGFLIGPDGGRAGLRWRGGAVAGRLLDLLSLRRFDCPLPLDGFAIDVDGEGTCLAPQALLRAMPREDAEAMLAEWLGARVVIWLETGLEGEPPPGRLVSVARFLRPGLVMALVGGESDDPNLAPLEANRDILGRSRDAAGRKLELVEAPQPRRRLGPDGRRVPMSYTDAFMGNAAIMLPAFDDHRDQTVWDNVVAALDANVFSVPAWDFATTAGVGLGSLVLAQPD